MANAHDEDDIHVNVEAAPTPPDAQSRYDETIPAGPMQSLVVFATAGIFAGAAGVMIRTGVSLGVAGIMLGVAVLVILVGFTMRTITVRVWDDRIELKQGPVTRTIEMETLSACSPGVRRWFGVHVAERRHGRSDATLYVNRYGPAAALYPTDGRAIIVSTLSPERLVDAVRHAMDDQPHITVTQDGARAMMDADLEMVSRAESG